jgi:hypothetical protein
VNIVAFNPFTHLDYARSVLTVPISSFTRGLVALDKNNVPKGIVLLDQWTENSVMGHIAIQHPMAMRKLPFEALDYVFNTLGKNLFMGAIPSDNPKSLKFNQHLGFEVVYTIEDGYDIGVDILLMQLKKENCKYIQKLKEVA